MATKLAMTRLSHMVLSPVVCGKLATNASIWHRQPSACVLVRGLLLSPSPPCPAIFCHYCLLRHIFPTAGFVKLLFENFFNDFNFFLRPFVCYICPMSSSSRSDTTNNLNNNLSTTTTHQRQVKMTKIFFHPLENKNTGK